jgi:hypothetical protein
MRSRDGEKSMNGQYQLLYTSIQTPKMVRKFPSVFCNDSVL